MAAGGAARPQLGYHRLSKTPAFRWSSFLIAALAALGLGCHFVDPECLFLPGSSLRGKGNGTLLQLDLSSKDWRHDEFRIGAGGGSEYSQLVEGFTACQRFSEDQLDALRVLWTELVQGFMQVASVAEATRTVGTGRTETIVSATGLGRNRSGVGRNTFDMPA